MIRPIKSAVTIWHLIRISSKNGLSLIIVFLTLVIPAITSYARAGITDVPSLEKDKPIERELAGGEAHSYRLTLVAGQFCHIVVDQRGIDVAVALYGPGGERIVEIDGTSSRNGPEPISLVAEASDSYTVAVLADPVFDSRDPRVSLSRKAHLPAVEATASASDVKRSAAESGLQDFARLRFSRQEADQIVSFASEGKKLEAVMLQGEWN